jgi:hypothetical protein
MTEDIMMLNETLLLAEKNISEEASGELTQT